MHHRYSVSSFRRSFLELVTKENASQAFAKRALDAAFKRHPDAYVVTNRNAGTLSLYVPKVKNDPDIARDSCLLLIQGKPTLH